MMDSYGNHLKKSLDQEKMSENFYTFHEKLINCAGLKELSELRVEIRRFLRKELEEQKLSKKNQSQLLPDYLRVVFLYSFNKWDKDPMSVEKVEALIKNNKENALKEYITELSSYYK